MPAVPPDLTSADADDLARLVASLSNDKLAEVMRGSRRVQILDEIFRRMSEHFAPEKAKGLYAVVDFTLSGRPDGGVDHYRAVIDDGGCVAGRIEAMGDAPPPRTAFRADAVAFLRLVTGAVSGVELLMTGRLKVRGDLLFAARIGGLFSMPKG